MKLMSLSIDVKKINKDRLYVGQKGTYLKVVVQLKDEVDQFGNNVSVWEEQTPEERKEKKKNYLGNGKVIFDTEMTKADSGDLPF